MPVGIRRSCGIFSVFLLGFGCDPAPASKPAPVATAASSPAVAPSPPLPSPSVASPPPAASTTITFNEDKVGAMAAAFEAKTGLWAVVDVAGQRGLQVDGIKGDVDGLLAIAKSAPAGDVRVSVRFNVLDGKIDQAAGLAFGIGATDYFGVRANALDGGVAFFKFAGGKRKIIETMRDIKVPWKTWHTLGIELRGAHLDVFFDGQRRFERLLDAPPVGKIGLWSRADSKVVFDDFVVTPL